MKRSAVIAVGAALFASALALPVPTEAQNTASGIPGYLNPQTGIFTTRAVLLPAAAALQRTGTIAVTTSVVIGSNIPASQQITCNVTISSFDSEFDNSASGSSLVARSGKSGKCRVTIPYIFEIASAKTTMTVAVSIFTSGSNGLTYSASHSFTPFAVPNGTKSLVVTLAL